jgi:hypothetical protein
MENDFKIIITTRDSARWLGYVLDWYQQHNLKPLFIVDSRTQDATRDLIEQYGFNYKEFLPRGDYPEAGMLEYGANQSDTDWILRLDDDELPNQSLIDWVKDVGVKSKNQCWYISRRELFFNKEKILYSRSIGKYPLAEHPDKLHPLARLYHRKRVNFLEEIHTIGLKDIFLYNFAPEENFIIHFNCLIHSMENRLRKLEFFEKLNPEFSWSLSDEYLPELFSPDFHLAKDDGLGEFLNFLNKFTPVPGGVKLNDTQQARIFSSVRARSQIILNKRYQASLDKNHCVRHVSADEVTWIEKMPSFLRKRVVNLLNTFPSKRNKNYAKALWNYCELYKL